MSFFCAHAHIVDKINSQHSDTSVTKKESGSCLAKICFNKVNFELQIDEVECVFGCVEGTPSAWSEVAIVDQGRQRIRVAFKETLHILVLPECWVTALKTIFNKKQSHPVSAGDARVHYQYLSEGLWRTLSEAELLFLLLFFICVRHFTPVVVETYRVYYPILQQNQPNNLKRMTTELYIYIYISIS